MNRFNLKQICVGGVLALLLSIAAIATPGALANAHGGMRKGDCLQRRHSKWIDAGIVHSRRGHLALVVDKTTHTMDMYRDGERVRTYPVELGMETKAEGGWRPTPVGIFDLKLKPYTKYYKALLYKMPGYYLIHGEGSGMGKAGTDWTFGCIALSNSDMDELFEQIGIEENGNPVGPKQRRGALKDARLIIVPSRLSCEG